MQNELNQYYINLLRPKYREAVKKKKSQYLDEAQEFTGLSRKRLITRLNEDNKKQRNYSKGRPRSFDSLIPHLRILRNLMGNISEKRIKAAIPIWIPHYIKHFGEEFTYKDEKKLRSVSAATIGRLIRLDLNLKGVSLTKPNERMKALIPLKRLDEKVTSPGTIQVDTVAHCGSMIAGKYCHTVTAVDLHTGWTENRAIWTKTSQEMIGAIRSIEIGFPFEIKNFDTDCGTEFLNLNVMEFLEKRARPIKMRRARPYKKNDQCYVEQKNFTHVRKIFKYHRIEDPKLKLLMNDIYQNYWNPLHNYFIPSFKLELKKRVNSKVVKVHETPKTPAQRIIEDKKIQYHIRKRIEAKYVHLDPITLKRELNKKLAIFTKELENYINQQVA